jgi:hypothetical protein
MRDVSTPSAARCCGVFWWTTETGQRSAAGVMTRVSLRYCVLLSRAMLPHCVVLLGVPQFVKLVVMPKNVGLIVGLLTALRAPSVLRSATRPSIVLHTQHITVQHSTPRREWC